MRFRIQNLLPRHVASDAGQFGARSCNLSLLNGSFCVTLLKPLHVWRRSLPVREVYTSHSLLGHCTDEGKGQMQMSHSGRCLLCPSCATNCRNHTEHTMSFFSCGWLYLYRDCLLGAYGPGPISTCSKEAVDLISTSLSLIQRPFSDMNQDPAYDSTLTILAEEEFSMLLPFFLPSNESLAMQ